MKSESCKLAVPARERLQTQLALEAQPELDLLPRRRAQGELPRTCDLQLPACVNSVLRIIVYYRCGLASAFMPSFYTIRYLRTALRRYVWCVLWCETFVRVLRAYSNFG